MFGKYRAICGKSNDIQPLGSAMKKCARWKGLLLDRASQGLALCHDDSKHFDP